MAERSDFVLLTFFKKLRTLMLVKWLKKSKLDSQPNKKKIYGKFSVWWDSIVGLKFRPVLYFVDDDRISSRFIYLCRVDFSYRFCSWHLAYFKAGFTGYSFSLTNILWTIWFLHLNFSAYILIIILVTSWISIWSACHCHIKDTYLMKSFNTLVPLI